jgi:hypothetical protein
MFIHVVYFWLKDGLPHEETARFIERLHSLLTIETVERGYTGRPAPTRRDVVDSTYSHSLILFFADKNAHDAYQIHPTHVRFIAECASLWKSVIVYDTVPA